MGGGVPPPMRMALARFDLEITWSLSVSQRINGREDHLFLVSCILYPISHTPLLHFLHAAGPKPLVVDAANWHEINMLKGSPKGMVIDARSSAKNLVARRRIHIGDHETNRLQFADPCLQN